MFLHQKKAEEAHRILEGLGPRVELVSEDLNSFSVFRFFYFSLSLSGKSGGEQTRDRVDSGARLLFVFTV